MFSIQKPVVPVALMLVLGACAAGRAQNSAQSGSALGVVEGQLRDLLQPMGVAVDRPMAVAGQSAQLQLQWNEAPSASRLSTEPISAGGSIEILTRRETAGPLPRRRALNLAPDRILIVGVDRQSRLRSWLVIPDPRVIRAEGPGPDGRLTGTVVQRDNLDFFVDVPDDPSIRELRIYEPQWNGQAFDLLLIGTVTIG